MVPWDEAPIGQLRAMEASPGDVDKVMARLKKLTVVVSLGLRDDYLLLAVGSSTDCLARLGKGKLLAGRNEFKPLEKFAGKELTSISYVSRALVAKLWHRREGHRRPGGPGQRGAAGGRPARGHAEADPQGRQGPGGAT